MGELEWSGQALDAPVDGCVRPSLSFELFFEQEQERLLRALSVITGSRREAEDLTQDAFVKVFERWDVVATMDAPAGYLHRTAMNLFRNQYRRAKVAIGRVVRVGPPQDVFKAVEDRDAAARALAALTARQRAALVLTEALGYSGEETGQLLGIKASTVWALTHQARTALRPTGVPTDVPTDVPTEVPTDG
ncbi:MAG: RNA polymerase sigma factor [Acidimicrobiales bacterium]